MGAPSTSAQQQMLGSLAANSHLSARPGGGRADRMAMLSGIVGRAVTSSKDLTEVEASRAIDIFIAARQINLAGMMVVGTYRSCSPAKRLDGAAIPASLLIRTDSGMDVIGMYDLDDPESDHQFAGIKSVAEGHTKLHGSLRLAMYGIPGVGQIDVDGGRLIMGIKLVSLPIENTHVPAHLTRDDPTGAVSSAFSL